MAHHVEPMDVDCISSDFDNKENTFHHSNVLPCTEKGYEELDISELNMKLRYSMTPASSPMSKSYTACLDNKNLETDELHNCSNENANLTRSLNSTMTKNDSVIKSLKSLPLQSLPTKQFMDGNGNPSVLRHLDSTFTDNANLTITVSGTNDNDENLSLPSSSSSALHTPEATTPTKDMMKDGGSPIMRGLKSVLNMFRSSQSPIPPAEDDSTEKHEVFSPVNASVSENTKHQAMVSTPIAAHRAKDSGNSSKRSSPYKDSIVFNDDLEKELNWKDESTVIFSDEKIPVHKLFFQQTKGTPVSKPTANNAQNSISEDNLDSTVEYMDVSYNESNIKEKTLTELHPDNVKHEGNVTVESDGEFVDCETTLNKTESPLLDKEKDILTSEEQLNTDVAKDISITTDNNKPQTANVSFPVEEFKNHVTEFSDSSDYSKETAEILSELVKLEENVSPKSEAFHANSKLEENITGAKLIGQNETYEKEKQETKEFEEIQSNIPVDFKQNATEELNVTEFIESKMLQISEAVSKSISQSEVKLQATQVHDITNVCHVTFDSPSKIADVNEKILDPTLLQDVKLESQSVVDSKNIEDTVPSEATHHATSESTDIMILQKSADISFTNDECQENNLEIVSSETMNVFGPEPGNVLESKPSDVPLPDEDDIDKEDIISGAAPVEILSITEPEMFNVTNNLPKLDSNVTEVIDINLQDTFAEDKIQKNSVVSEIITTIHDTAVAQLDDDESAKIDVTKTFDDRALESFSETAIENVIPPEQSEMHLAICSNLPFTPHKLTPELTLDVIETTDEKILEAASKNGEGCNVDTFDQTYMNFSDVTQIVDVSQRVTNELNATDVPEHFIKQDENKIQDESAEVTNNEALNYLPDVVNQTIVITDENLHILTKATDTDNISSEAEPNQSVLNTITTSPNLERELEINSEKTKNKSECTYDSISVSDSTLPNTATGQLNTENDLFKNSQPAISQEETDKGLEEKIQSNNGNDNTEVNISCDHPSEVVENIPTEKVKVKGPTVDEEIIVSESNSPYVSLMVSEEPEQVQETFETVESPFVTNTNLASSPPITSKGYNFNFDEMDDPFATKTKIRLSPPPATPTKLTETEDDKKDEIGNGIPKKIIANKRKSHFSERKKTGTLKTKPNSSNIDASRAKKTSANKLDATFDIDETKPNSKINREISEAILNNEPTVSETKPFDSDQTIESKDLNKFMVEKQLCGKFEEGYKDVLHKSDESHKISEENKSSIESVAAVSNDFKTTSSSEQSTYYSAGASSTESSKCKNVFNLPEIDDVNFNPFVTKSKMRQSPPPEHEVLNPFATRTKIKNSPNTSIIVPSESDPNCTIMKQEDNLSKLSKTIDFEDKVETELMEKESAANITNTTSSSKVTDDQNLTTRELNTEDEDTIEGPFLEADDHIDKLTDCDADSIDMMQFNDLPAQRVENNSEEGELFIDAEAFEFLLNQNKSNVVADSGKESLFLKFDPLFAKRISSDAVLAALSKVQKKQSTPTKPTRPSLRNEASPIAGPSNLNVTYEGDDNISQESTEDVNVTVSKPMMVVTPAVNPVVSPRNKSITPTRSNRRSITFTSPAIAVIDRLLSMSGNSSFVEQDIAVTQSNRDHTEADLALTQLRELLAEKEISVYNLRSESKELKDRLAAMETQVRILEADGQDRLRKINELNERLAEKTKINKSMAAVVEEYERTIASLIAETEQDKKRHAEERIRLINERDEQTAHLASMEVSFSDLHSKYEKSKQVIFACKANEESYKKSLKESEENLTKMQTNYETLKQHATSKLNHANKELEKINKAHEAEVVKLSAMIKRKDLHITSLEETLAQKTKANEELTAICDELINKVG